MKLTLVEYMKKKYTDKYEFSNWKQDNDKSLKEKWFETLYQEMQKREIIPSLGLIAENGFTLIDVSANNGSVPIYLAKRLRDDYIEQFSKEPTNISIYVNDIVREILLDTQDKINKNDYELFGKKYGSNPSLKFTNQNACNLSFGPETFDVILDFRGALWYALNPGSSYKNKTTPIQLFSKYYSLLKPSGHLIIDNYASIRIGSNRETSTGHLLRLYFEHIQPKTEKKVFKEKGTKLILKDKQFKGNNLCAPVRGMTMIDLEKI